jgi:sulfonate transport system substrate-binding protein
MRKLRTIVAAVMLLAAGVSAAPAAEPLTIHAAWVTLAAAPLPLALERKDLLPHYGRSYVVEANRVASTAAVITGLASGDIEVGPLAFSSLAFAVLNAKMNDIRVIMDVTQDGVYGSDSYMVLRDSGIKAVADLNGKVLASLTYGSAVDIAVRAMLRKHGLNDKKDVSFIEAQFPNMKPMLLSHKVDLISVNEPWVDDPELQEKAVALFTTKEAVGVSQLLVWTARAPFIAAHRGAMVDFLEDMLRFTRWELDPANHAAMVAMVSQQLKQPPAQLDYLFTKKDLYKDPNGLPNMEALQANIDLEKELGFIDRSIAVKDYEDLSLIREAALRLK